MSAVRVMVIDRETWSGDGDFTLALLEALSHLDQHIVVVKVQDAPASRAETTFSFIGNDVFVGFRIERGVTLAPVLGFLPLPRFAYRKTMSLEGLAAALGPVEGIGAPDYADESMLQYMRAERVVPPYQTRGQKIVEVVRIFEATPLMPVGRTTE